ncbi:MAG: ABC transporter substrate-binding protein, partial [Pararhizobium sp.]
MPAAKAIAALALVAALAGAAPARADAAQQWRTGVALIGTPKYQTGFPHFDYVNPDAPKGGTLNLSETGSFDTLNPLLSKGDPATGLNLVFEPLMTPSLDEVESSYGLLAEAVSYPPDVSSATFRLRKEARFSDGTPVTPEDVVWSFENAIELNPQQHFYYKHVKSAEKTGPNEVTFHFDEK